jgi:hypothetical protein
LLLLVISKPNGLGVTALDGEAVVCGPDGVAIFDALHRRGTVSEAMLYAFDLLELDGEDLRGLPLSDRKRRLARLLGGRRLGIVLSDHTDEDGSTIFRQACVMGLEGIVSKRLTAPLQVGPVAGLAEGQEPSFPSGELAAARLCRGAQLLNWLKVKNNVDMCPADNDVSIGTMGGHPHCPSLRP